MADRTLYFNTLKKAFGALALHSDVQIARAAVRFGNLADLLDIKTRAGGDPTVDQQNSGFPLLPEVVRVAGDLRKGTAVRSRPTREIVDEMLDEMIVGKRLPGAQLVEDMALALYVERIASLGKGDSGADEVVGANVTDTFKRISPREIDHSTTDVVYEWDYWPATNSQPSVTTARLVLESEDPASAEGWAKVELIRAAHGFTGAGHTLLQLAQAVDKFQKARLKQLVRITFTNIETPLFHATDDDFHQRLSGIEDEETAWILRFRVVKLNSKGTVRRAGGFLSGEVASEDFYVNVHREDTKRRSCSTYDEHVLMTASAYKAISDKTDFLRDTTVHVVSDDGLTLNENI